MLTGSRLARRAFRAPYPAFWLLLALLVGALAGLLPLQWSLPLLSLAALALLSLIEVRIALLTALAVAPLKTLIETESGLPLPLDIGQIALLSAFAIWLVRAIAADRRLGLRWTPVYGPLLLFTFAASLSLWVALSPGAVVAELLKWIEMLALVALVVALGQKDGAWWVAAAVILAAVIQALIGLYQFMGGSGAPHLWILDYRFFRAFGTFGQPNPFGAFMGLALPLALGAAFGAASAAWEAYRCYRRSGLAVHRDRALASGLGTLAALVGAGIIGAGLLASWSRGAWLGAAAALLVLILFAPRRRRVGAALAGLSILGLWLSIVTGIAPESLTSRIADFTQDLTAYDVRGQVINDANYAVLERLAHWQAALGMASDAPWLGIGFGNYEIAYPRYALMNWPFALGHAHNYYLNLLAETGVIGLSAYLIAWGMIFGLTRRALRRGAGLGRGLALGLLGAWAHLTVHSFFDKLYVNNLFLHIGALLGLIGVLLLTDAGRQWYTISTFRRSVAGRAKR